MTAAGQYFSDSAAYDCAMGRCSRVAGESFLDWLDVGCGTGSFTELVLDRCAPGSVAAIDPSAEQIAFARSKPWAEAVDFRQADAMSLPFDDHAFDVAVLALVIQYIPDPATALREIVRVVRPGGTVAAYTWPGSYEDHPMQPMSEAMAELGISRASRPGNSIRTVEAITALFGAAGLVEIDSRSIEIRMVYADFEDYWSSQSATNIKDASEAETRELKTLMQQRLPPDASGRITYGARANAVRGLIPTIHESGY